MYICKDCGQTFKAPFIRLPFGSHHEEDAELLCPECYSEHYTEAEQCPRCKKWFEPFNGDFCPECTEYVNDTMKDLFNGLEGRAWDDMEFAVKKWLDANW